MKLAMMCVLTAALAFGAGPGAAEPPATKPPVSGKTDPPPAALPDAVKAAIAKAFPDAKIEGVHIFTRNDVKLYSVQMGAGEKGRTLMFVHVTEGGVIVMVTTMLEAEELPKPVADAAKKASGDANILNAAKMEQRAGDDFKPLDKAVTTYQVFLSKGRLMGDAIVAEDGTVKRAPKMAPPVLTK